jgi:hypothetical protein
MDDRVQSGMANERQGVLSKPKNIDKETAQERNARIFPLATKSNRERRAAGGEEPSEADVKAYFEAWRDEEHRFEGLAGARQILTSKWPDGKAREGRAKLGDYSQLLLILDSGPASPSGDPWREIATRPYSVELVDGTQAHRCLFEMNDAQRKAVEKALDEAATELLDAKADVRAFNAKMRRAGVPPGIAPAQHFLGKAPQRHAKAA